MEVELFLCARRNLKLTTGGCSRLWQGAIDNAPQEHEGRHECVGCPVGAKNAGKTVPVMQEAVTDIKRICPRCTRLSPRLINDRHCISCYNRQLEAIRGKNARGGRPRLSDELHDQTLAVVHGGVTSNMTERNVRTTVETILLISHKAKLNMAFAPAAVVGWVHAK